MNTNEPFRIVLWEEGRLTRVNGQTWFQWARDLFEYENCDECGKGVRGHEAEVFAGHWFARCKKGSKP